MNNLEKRKNIGVLIAAIIFIAFAMSAFTIAVESNRYIVLRNSLSNTNSYVNIMQDKNNPLHLSCQELLANNDVKLELRYYMAKQIAKIAQSDQAILFLIANELSKIFSCEIEPVHYGYLITSSDNWAILIEHGYHLLQSNTAPNVIYDLSKDYNEVIIAACNSYIIARNFANVKGFRGDITIGTVLEYLSSRYKSNINYLNDIFECSININ